MTSSRDRRVAKELADIHADRDHSGVFAAPTDGVSLRHLTGSFPAPADTPYAGGHYEVEVEIPEGYPFKPPKMRFRTPVWHPNVSSQTGAICLDTLTTAWSPVQTIKTALLSLRVLLEFPNAKDPQDAEVARMMTDAPARFAATAREWAVRYAGAPRTEGAVEGEDGAGTAEGTAAAGGEGAVEGKKRVEEPRDEAIYGGYNMQLVGNFTNMGFAIPDVVEAFDSCGVNRNNGQYYELEEEYLSEVVGKLLGEH